MNEIGDCPWCGITIFSEDDYVTWNASTYCSKECACKAGMDNAKFYGEDEDEG